MKRLLLSVVFFLAAASGVSADTPEQIWKASLVQDNVDWAQKPHAILKIQDAAYLGEGQSATLRGTRGQPASYRWAPGTKVKGVLVVTFVKGHFSAVMNGKTIDEAALSKTVVIDKDIDISGQATQVNAGVPGARIFLYNQQAAAAKAFKGVDYFPYDPAYRVQASFKPDPKLVPHAFRTSRGTDKEFYHAGDATFTLEGKRITLPFYASNKDPKKIATFAAFFTDALTGKETYGAGRYVDIEKFGAYPPKTITIDFNYAYNPNCSRSDFYTCPIAIDNLVIAVRAGEKDPHTKH
ncbi:MAG: DUF1684 domain-containing protein [Proteobacteria bacterium]|nr:DUF1684 domain-containing protein [Pseudomonadota bacterium]